MIVSIHVDVERLFEVVQGELREGGSGEVDSCVGDDDIQLINSF